MNRNIIIGVIAIIIIALGGWYFFMRQPAPVVEENTMPSGQTATNNNPDQSNPIGADVGITVAKTYEVIYTDSGFSPSTLTIKAGDTVTWKNQSSSNMWVGSAMHPTHTVYSGTTLQQHCPDTNNDAFDECKGDAPGTSWSFTFTKTGSWGYHDHLDAKHFGKINVE